MKPGDIVYYKNDTSHKGIVLKVAETLVEVLWLTLEEPEWMPHYSLGLDKTNTHQIRKTSWK